MFRFFSTRVLRALVPAVALAGSAGMVLDSIPAHASFRPTVTVRCLTTPIPNQVVCWTWGNGFAGGEWVHLSYNVTFLTMPKVNGRRPSKTFARSVKTNAAGTFTRTPHVTFMTVKAHSTFRIGVDAVGASKDKGSTSLAAIGT